MRAISTRKAKSPAKAPRRGKTKSSTRIGSHRSLDDLWRALDEIAARVPEEAWANVPSDLSANVDRYAHHAAKR
jgi:hypothetical protein